MLMTNPAAAITACTNDATCLGLYNANFDCDGLFTQDEILAITTAAGFTA